MSRYQDILAGLNEAVAYERGDTSNARAHRMCVHSVKVFTPSEIRDIRLRANMTQGLFAACVGVTQKAVEAWEGGRSKPDGAARRTIGLFEANPRFADEAGIIDR